MTFAEYETPCGRLLIGVHGNGICLCDWILGDRTERTLHRINRFLPSVKLPDDESLLDVATGQLDAYFSGAAWSFDIPTLPLGTRFQLRVWEAIGRIPYGKTVSYKELAESVGMPRGVRAVAAAVGANPLSIMVPCHRVVGSDGSLTGYAGGLEAKSYLLQLETPE